MFRRKEDALIVEALWRHYSFREMFPELQQGLPFHWSQAIE